MPPLFDGLEFAPALLLAISGGPDSMAMLLLAARWAARLGGGAPALHVATVDHGLRLAARDEASLVAAAATRLGLPHATLAWEGQKPSTRIQERARVARYALLAAHARAVGATHVLTAHHADDQAETVLMRLARGSGLAGLAGMRRETRLAPDIVLVRPLLETPKADLVALCRAEGIAVADDPSNHDPAYARTRLRAAAPALADLGLDSATLARLARRAVRADAALEAEVDRIEALVCRSMPDGRCAMLGAGRDLQLEILLRLVRRAIEATVPAGGAIRLERLESLTEAVAVALAQGRPHRATLGGARIVLDVAGTLTIDQAPPRRPPPEPCGGAPIVRSAEGSLD